MTICWNRRRRGALAALGAALALLTGCGEQVAGVGGEGTGTFAMGRVDGFGSIVIAGQSYDDRDARVLLEVDPRAPLALPLTALRLGMVARFEQRPGEPVTIRVAPELRATIADLDLAQRRFSAAGQIVQLETSTSEPTALDGWQTIADLREGDAVEVHGERDAQGVIRASLLVRVPDDSGVRVSGVIQARNVAAGRWEIGALSIDTTRAVVLPSGRALASGDRVVVYSSAELLGVMTADVIAIQAQGASATGEVAGPARLAGVLTEAPSLARLRLLGREVDASSAAIEGGSAADLVVGRRVVIEGEGSAQGIRASRVLLIDPAAAPLARLAATVGNFADAGAFAVRQNSVDASAAAFSGLAVENLANGVPVRISGAWRGGAVAASVALTQAGRVDSLDPATGSLRLAGLDRALRLAPGARYVGLRPGDLIVGVRVIVRGTMVDGELRVTDVSAPDPLAVIDLQGIAGNVEATPAGGEFEIGEADMVWTPTTVFRGATQSAADLVNGRVVRVRAVRDGAVFRAIEVDARASLPGTVRLRGTLTQATDLATLRLDGQRIDARAATFDPPELRDALAGAYVDVEGVLVDGVLQATRISDP